MNDWLSACGVAVVHNTTQARVLTALSLIGIQNSQLNSRLENGARVYSPDAVALVVRELKSRDTDIGGVMVTDPMSVLTLPPAQTDHGAVADQSGDCSPMGLRYSARSQAARSWQRDGVSLGGTSACGEARPRSRR